MCAAGAEPRGRRTAAVVDSRVQSAWPAVSRGSLTAGAEGERKCYCGDAGGTAEKVRAAEQRRQRRLRLEQAIDAGGREIAGSDRGQRRLAGDFEERAGERGAAGAGEGAPVGGEFFQKEEALEQSAQRRHPEEGVRGEAGEQAARRLVRARVLGFMPYD